MEHPTINPTPPLLPDLTWREITPDDLAALVELATECHSADGGLALMNEPGNLRDRYFPVAPGRSIGAFAADEQLVACAGVHLTRASGTERAIILGQVRPQWRNRGIGTYLIKWSEAQSYVQFTAGMSDRQVLQVATETLTDSASRLYRAHGFELVFQEQVMRRDLCEPIPDRALPPGVTITSWQPELADRFFQVYEASFRERPGFPGWSADAWIAEMTEDESARPEWSLLARTGEVPVGFVTAATDNPGGFIVQIGVIPEQRRLGLGSALTIETMRRMRADGESAVQLTVNINNPRAIKAFVQLGFATIGRRARYERIAEQ